MKSLTEKLIEAENIYNKTLDTAKHSIGHYYKEVGIYTGSEKIGQAYDLHIKPIDNGLCGVVYNAKILDNNIRRFEKYKPLKNISLNLSYNFNRFNIYNISILFNDVTTNKYRNIYNVSKYISFDFDWECDCIKYTYELNSGETIYIDPLNDYSRENGIKRLNLFLNMLKACE